MGGFKESLPFVSALRTDHDGTSELRSPFNKTVYVYPVLQPIQPMVQ